MPRHDPSKTPPEKRRAPKGGTAGKFDGFHTAESLVFMTALQDRWKTNGAMTIRKALEEAFNVPALVDALEEANTLISQYAHSEPISTGEMRATRERIDAALRLVGRIP